MLSHQGSDTVQDSSLNSACLSALTLSTSLVENAMKWCPVAEHLKQGKVDCAKMSVFRKKSFFTFWSTHLLCPLFIFWIQLQPLHWMLVIQRWGNDKLGLGGPTKQGTKPASGLMIMLLSAPSHWVFVGHPCLTPPCDLQGPVFFSCRCTGNVLTDVWVQQYILLINATNYMLPKKSLPTFSRKKV